MTLLFKQPKRVGRFLQPIKNAPQVLKTFTLRSFDGGWNVLINDLNMDPKYAKVLRNMYRAQDGSMAVRWGTRLFSDLSNAGAANIINMEYFNNFIVAIDANGFFWTIDGQGVIRNIWSPFIASKLQGAPAGWGTCAFASFEFSQGNLIVCDGSDKPAMISSTMQTTYLQDLATSSNVFVPRAKYVKAIGGFLCMAGDPSAPATLYIGSQNTTGTFFGAPAPNNGVNIDLSVKVPKGDKAIKGLGRFRDKLIVFFSEAALVMTLGIFDASGNHTPSFDEVLDLLGAVSHRGIQTVVDDIFFTDSIGIATLTRTLFNTLLKPDRASPLIDPEIQSSFEAITLTSILENNVFSVYNRLESQYMLFIPYGTPTPTETRGFIFTQIKGQSISHFAEFRGWNWSSACRSAGNRVFFSKGKQIFILGSITDPIYADYVNDQSVFSDGTQFTDGTGFTVTATETDTGVPITFDWQLPWMDFKQRLNTKSFKYIGVDTLGTATFNIDTFADNILTDASNTGDTFIDGTIFTDGFGWTTPDPVYTPQLSISMAGGDRLGFGGDGFGDDFGGNRPSRDERLYAWPVKGKIHKLRIWGDTREQLHVVALSFGYMQGSIRRS